MVGPWTGRAVNQIPPLDATAHQAVPLRTVAELVHTFKTIPITIRNGVHGRFEAMGMIAPVAAVAQQKLLLMIAAVTELTKRFHDALVPRHRRLQHICTHRELRRSFTFHHSIPPVAQTFGVI